MCEIWGTLIYIILIIPLTLLMQLNEFIETSTNVPGRPEGSYLKFYKCLNYIFNNNTFSPI